MAAPSDDHPDGASTPDRDAAGVSAGPVAAGPVAAASVALFRGDRVLMVQRARGAAAGRWSLPGGHVEPGESDEAAARREAGEETGLWVTAALDFVAHHDVVVGDPGAVAGKHYRISVFAGQAPAGDPVAASDARQARFVDFAELPRLPLTDGALSLIRRAHAQFSAMIGRNR